MISLVFLVFMPFCDSDLKYLWSDSQYTKVVMSWFSLVTSKIEILCDTNLFSDMIFFLLIPQMTVSNAFSLINLYYITLKNLDPGSRADLGQKSFNILVEAPFVIFYQDEYYLRNGVYQTPRSRSIHRMHQGFLIKLQS